MGRGPAFIKWEVFTEIFGYIRAADGKPYQDLPTIYGDMSRLVVAWLARTTPDEIIRIYNELGWGGTANGRALHEAARHWMDQYHPGRMSGEG